MNVNAIWEDEEYAFYPYRPNQTFVMNARRGRCIKTSKKKPQYGKKSESIVTFEVLYEDNGEPTGRTEEIRARDVIEFWNDYVNERKALKEEREEKQRMAEQRAEELRREREERYRQEAEAREARLRAAQQKNDQLKYRLIAKGIPADAIKGMDDRYVQLDRLTIELWLSV